MADISCCDNGQRDGPHSDDKCVGSTSCPTQCLTTEINVYYGGGSDTPVGDSQFIASGCDRDNEFCGQRNQVTSRVIGQYEVVTNVTCCDTHYCNSATVPLLTITMFMVMLVAYIAI